MEEKAAIVAIIITSFAKEPSFMWPRVVLTGIIRTLSPE